MTKTMSLGSNFKSKIERFGEKSFQTPAVGQYNPNYNIDNKTNTKKMQNEEKKMRPENDR